MPVSPIIKQDLLLIKQKFEEKVLEKDTRGALLLPMVSTVQNSRQIHQIIRNETSKYPSATIQDKKAKKDQGFLKQLQAECIPCAARIKALGDLDISEDLFATLAAYDERALQNILNLFKSISRPNRIQENLCAAYKALRSQCIPDLARLLSALTLLMGDLRSFNLKSLKDQLLGLIGSLIIRSIAFGALNYDMYVKLITDTLRCIVRDINTQLAKLEPILSRDGLEDIAELLPLDTRELPGPPYVGGTISREQAAKRKVDAWFPDKGDFNVSQDISKKIGSFVRDVEGGAPIRDANGNIKHKKGLKNLVNYSDSVNIGRIIADLMEDAVSVVDNKFQNATQELLKFLKISNGNLKQQIQLIDQITLIRSLLEVIKTIIDTRGDFDPCGENAGRRFFSSVKFPGQDIVITNNSDPDQPENVEADIISPDITISNPIVEEILNDNGIETGPIKSGRIIKSTPITINIAECLTGS